MRAAQIAAALVCVGVAALTGCSDSGSSRDDAAGDAARAFSTAASAAPTTACAMLAPETRHELEAASGPCSQALPDVALPAGGQVLEVDVYGLDARVRMEHDTLFLALFDTGWRVTAAGCTPTEQDRPYSCDLKGA